MLLSNLVYSAVKDVVYDDNTSFSYANFIDGKYTYDSEYSLEINNVFSPLNEAIARLSDLERIPYRVEVCQVNNGYIDLTSLNCEVKEVINIAIQHNGDFIKVEYIPYGVDKVYIPGFNPELTYVIEYKEELPYFNDSYLPQVDTSGNIDNSKDVNLKDYGINNAMCNYIIEYIKGKLYEQVSVDIANMHITRAEQYFTGLRANISALKQKVVRAKYNIE